MHPESVQAGLISYLPYKIEAVCDWAESKFDSCQVEEKLTSWCSLKQMGVLDWQEAARCDVHRGECEKLKARGVPAS